MISFRAATDEELATMREVIDSLALAEPGLIHTNAAWCRIVHAVINEIFVRTMNATAAA